MIDNMPEIIATKASIATAFRNILSQYPIQRSLALVIAAMALFWAIYFPAFALGLCLTLCLYAATLIWRWNTWLILLPALLPLLYLTPHSGRIFFDEFDLLLMMTVAAGLWQGRLTVARATLAPSSRLVLALFILCYGLGIYRGLGNWEALDFNALANYYSPINALRVGKGFFWALLIYFFWAGNCQANSEKTKRLFTLGIISGAIGVFMVVLWERGVVHDLFFANNRYQLLSSLLDFSTLYRVTALFADMHTGGTAIDGYVSLVWPFAAYLLLTSKNRLLMAIGGVSLLGIFYVMVVTFSRGVYLGIGVSLITATTLGYYYHRRQIGAGLVLLTLACLGTIAAVAIFVFRAGGVLAIGSDLIAFFIGAAIALLGFKRLSGYTIFAFAAMGVGACVLVTSHAVLTSKWTEIAHSIGLPVSIASIFLFAATGFFLQRRWSPYLTLRNQILVSLLICGLIAAFVPSLFGSRMEQRFATVTEDLLHRVDHWHDAINIMDDNWHTKAFGQGLGRFPERYFWQKQQATDVGGFIYLTENNNTFLRFNGAHDVRLGQRLDLKPNTDYRLALDIRTTDPAAPMEIRICHRHLIHPTEWNSVCEEIKHLAKTPDGQWQHLQYNFNSNKLGAFRHHVKAPLMLTITNRREYAFNLKPQTLLDFDNITLQSTSGREMLNNGDFEKGVDNWFPYYDFNHLPWHIKNIWVHVYFELGLLGLALFGLLILGAIRGLANSPIEQRGFSIAILLALIGFLAVGTFGTLIDAPRVAFLFYLLILIGLAKSRKTLDT